MIRDLILKIEEAKSNKSKCSMCNRQIQKGELRGLAWDNYWNIPYFYCKECSIKILENNIKEEKKMLEELGKLEINIDDIQELAIANGMVVK